MPEPSILLAIVLAAVALALLYALVTHKGPAPIQQAEAVVAHRVAVEAVAAWEKAVAAAVADAKAAQAKADAAAALLAAFKTAPAAPATSAAP